MVILKEWGVSLTARETDFVCCPTLTTSRHMRFSASKPRLADERTFCASHPGHRQTQLDLQLIPKLQRCTNATLSGFLDTVLNDTKAVFRSTGILRCVNGWPQTDVSGRRNGPHLQGSIRATATNTFTTNHLQSQHKMTRVTCNSPALTFWTRRFNIRRFHVPSTQYICMYRTELGKSSDYFPIQH